MLLVSVGLLICFVGAWSKEGPKGPVRRILRKREVNENEEFLNAHNEMRRIVSPSATNMREMKWSEELATVAYNYASQCVFRHNSERSRQSATFNYVGENIYIGTYGYSASFSVTLWDNEKHVYNFSSNTCTGVCGHYTQVDSV
ncbi:GLIPR1-like protein 1 [Saccostrea cucullata]|uniref:GLIPR1-like protein 1 n=1 Tax=Saccostrea cuccullata TaxID=36930 RepID=UPI002ED51D44